MYMRERPKWLQEFADIFGGYTLLLRRGFGQRREEDKFARRVLRRDSGLCP